MFNINISQELKLNMRTFYLKKKMLKTKLQIFIVLKFLKYSDILKIIKRCFEKKINSKIQKVI